MPRKDNDLDFQRFKFFSSLFSLDSQLSGSTLARLLLYQTPRIFILVIHVNPKGVSGQANADYTLNLLYSVNRVDYFDVLRGPSNGMELLNFFNEALSVNRVDGSTVLENGDVVIMGNC